MSELAAVKAAVKAWEKSFKARNQRDPTKDDIKNDPGSIGEKYAVYRKLSKLSQSKSGSSLPSTTSSSASIASRGESSRSTPRVVPYNEYPTTPTPPTRRSSGSRVRQVSPTRTVQPVNNRQSTTLPNGGHSSEAVNAAGPSSPLRLLTPKKARPYSGPIHDPNPVNPFAVTPTKTPSSTSRTLFSRPPDLPASSSPFIHASSPRKLKQVLEANSLRKVREREEEITPRTRARKRLRGEVVADTPVKDRPVRRRRGEGKVAPAPASEAAQGDANGTLGKGKRRTEIDDLEDEFGPSPMRPEVDGTFTELFEEEEVLGDAEKRGRPSAMLGLFGRAVKTQTSKGREVTGAPEPEADPSPPRVPASPHDSEVALPQDDPPVISEDHEDLESERAKSASTSKARPPKTITFSDDEQDEWDPEGGHIQHQLLITGTRRVVRQPRNSLSDELSNAEQSHEDDDAEDSGMDHPTPELMENTTEGTSHNSLHPSSPAATAPPLLSLLSLQSPRKSTALTEMRYKAIFDPSEAARLRAIRRGQDVYISGEGAEEVEEWDGTEEQAAVEGDDDWEEEPDGWKDAAVGVEEDW